MWLHRKCVMSRLIQKFHSIKKHCFYLAVTNDVLLNKQNDELQWWSMKLSASKICNESVHAKIAFNKYKNCSYLAFTKNVLLNRQNDEWHWWSMKVSAPEICNESNNTKIVFNLQKMFLPWCHQKYLIESTK